MTSSIGISSKITKGDNYFLALKDQVQAGDKISFNGEKVTVLAVSEDFMNAGRNCIRTTEDFKSTHNPQTFKMSSFTGVTSVDFSALNDYRALEIKHMMQKDAIWET
ncbi:MAG: hypothetical protein ABGX43_09665 [Nitrospinaceae bacterium]